VVGGDHDTTEWCQKEKERRGDGLRMRFGATTERCYKWEGSPGEGLLSWASVSLDPFGKVLR